MEGVIIFIIYCSDRDGLLATASRAVQSHCMKIVPDVSEILLGPVENVAPRLLGCLLVRTYHNMQLVGRIVETEAYDESEAASHTYRGKTPRTEIMFGPPGYLYVYFTYGMHYCCNVVTGPEGTGAAVLVRAIEPLEGMSQMSDNRHGLRGERLTNGPAKLCQAMQIDKRLNGHFLQNEPLELLVQPALEARTVIQTTRIGISKAKELPRRFYIKDNPYISRAH
jgi:DNA-3-methyladenine glycosylase